MPCAEPDLETTLFTRYFFPLGPRGVKAHRGESAGVGPLQRTSTIQQRKIAYAENYRDNANNPPAAAASGTRVTGPRPSEATADRASVGAMHSTRSTRVFLRQSRAACSANAASRASSVASCTLKSAAVEPAEPSATAT